MSKPTIVMTKEDYIHLMSCQQELATLKEENEDLKRMTYTQAYIDTLEQELADLKKTEAMYIERLNIEEDKYNTLIALVDGFEHELCDAELSGLCPHHRNQWKKIVVFINNAKM